MADAAAPSGLGEAAALLEAELARYERLVRALEREPLGTAKQVRRAAQQLSVLAECEARLEAGGRALVAAVSAARDRQQALAAGAVARAEDIQARSAVLQEMLARLERLGAAAADVNARAQAILAEHDETDGGGVVEAAAEIAARLETLADDAATLRDGAAAGALDDLARDAEDLRRSLRAVIARLRALGAPAADG